MKNKLNLFFILIFTISVITCYSSCKNNEDSQPCGKDSSLIGKQWTARAMPVSATWVSVAYGNCVFIAIAYDIPATTVVATSP